MNWAEHDREREEREYLMPKHPAIRDVRNCAAAELFCLTGESKWNSLFLETTPYKNSAGAVEYTWDSLDQADCAWVYARADRPGVDEKVKRNRRDVVLNDADPRVASTERTGFRWAKHPYTPVVYGGLSSPENAICVARAPAGPFSLVLEPDAPINALGLRSVAPHADRPEQVECLFSAFGIAIVYATSCIK